MPLIYFVAAALGVLGATIVAGFIKTKETWKRERQQLMLEMENSERDQSARDHEPAAMISAVGN